MSHLLHTTILVATLFLVSSYQQSCSTHNNQDINQPNLSLKSGQAVGSCCNLCSSTSGCKGFSWNDYEGGTCYLKGDSGPLISKDGVTAGTINKGDGGSNTGGLVTFEQFSNAVVNSDGYPKPSEAQYNSFIQGLPKGVINTKEEAAMSLTQFLHESDGLRAKTEYRCLNNGCPGDYVYPSCDAPGKRYYGRGYIQLTWCYNYKAASQDLFGNNQLVEDPDSVAQKEDDAWDTAFWFWKVNVHSKPGVSDGQFGSVTRAINGALECDAVAGQSIAKHRYEMYGKVRAAFGLSGPGNEKGCYN